MNSRVIYTIGHSTHSAAYFLDLLQTHAITCLVDVRSVAASRYNPQFNKAALSLFLKENGIAYLHFGKEFGARQTEPTVLDNNGKVDFDKVRKTKEFKSGIERLKKGIKGYSIALMCAEADPLHCHRFWLVSVALQQEDFEVLHILKDKTVLSNNDLEQKLLKQNKKHGSQPNIFDINKEN